MFNWLEVAKIKHANRKALIFKDFRVNAINGKHGDDPFFRVFRNFCERQVARILTEKEMKKLSRADLLELLIAQTKETDRLRARLNEAEKQLEDRRITIENCGSIAEASLQLSGIFEVAQSAADEYLENVKAYGGDFDKIVARREQELVTKANRMLADAERKCKQAEAEAKKKCDDMLRIARKEADSYWERTSSRRSSSILQTKSVMNEGGYEE